MTRFILPNYHVILIHFPLALLGVGMLIELFSFLWRRSSARDAARWMILLGALAMIPAATTGIYAFQDVVGHGQQHNSWAEAKASSGFSDADWIMAKRHIIYNSVAAGLALFAAVSYLAASDRWRKRIYPAMFILLLFAWLLMGIGAWHGGEMVYRLGFGVQGINGVEPTTAPAATAPATAFDKFQYVMPIDQLHLILAGCVFAVTAAALGLSIRRSLLHDALLMQRAMIYEPPPVDDVVPVQGENRPISLLGALRAQPIPVAPRIPSARFWLLAALLAICAILTGLCFGGYILPNYHLDLDHLSRSFHDIRTTDGAREGIHIVLGLAILGLVLLLALLTRVAPRSRVIFSAIAFLLVLVMAAQIWVGILLLYDTGAGPLRGFQAASSTTQPSMASNQP